MAQSFARRREQQAVQSFGSPRSGSAGSHPAMRRPPGQGRLRSALLCTCLWLATGVPAASSPQVLDRRCNESTSGRQSAVSLEVGTDTVLAVWQSRRRDEGWDAVLGRVFDLGGRPLGPERPLGDGSRGNRRSPVLAATPSGGLWAAWVRNGGAELPAGLVVLRPLDGRLAPLGEERQVDPDGLPRQAEPRLAIARDGTTLVLWSASVAEGRRVLRARRLSADGSFAGPAWTLGDEQLGSSTCPTVVAAVAGGWTVAWAQSDGLGRPAALRGLRIDSTGRAGESFAWHQGQAMEPVIAQGAGGHWWLAWFERVDGRDELRWGSWTLDEQGQPKVASAGARAPGPGLVPSGLALSPAQLGGVLLAWGESVPVSGGQADLWTLQVAADGSPAGEPERATEAKTGAQGLAGAHGGNLLEGLGPKGFVLAWSGEAGLGDASGAHLSWIGQAPTTSAGDPGRAAAAAPHRPPSVAPGAALSPVPYAPRQHPLTGQLGFPGITYTGWNPPDTDLAVGPQHLVEVTNGAVSFFLKDGTQTFQQALQGSSGFWGDLGARNFVFDPEARWDPHDERFFIVAIERGINLRPYVLLAVSDDADPNGTWHRYRWDVQQLINDNDIDSPNLGLDAERVVIAADFFERPKTLVQVLDKAPLLTGAPLQSQAFVLQDQFVLATPVNHELDRPIVMAWSPYQPQGADFLVLYALTEVQGLPVLVTAAVDVPAFTQPERPPQLGTTVRPNTFEARIWSCVQRGGSLWLTHHVDRERVRQRWYEFDLGDWPNSGEPSLAQWGEVDPGPPVRTYFGALTVDAEGDMALVCARSSPDEPISMVTTFRDADDPPGTTRPSVIVRTSTAPDTTNRWGDYAGIGTEPDEPGVFWAAHETTDGNWSTWIQRMESSPAVEAYCGTSPNSVGAGALLSADGSSSLAAANLVLGVEGAVPGVWGRFFFGPDEALLPFGEGSLCVGGGLTRFAPVPVDSGGAALQPVDPNLPPAAGAFAVGEQWRFQFAYRDPGGSAGFNASNGLAVTWLP